MQVELKVHEFNGYAHSGLTGNEADYSNAQLAQTLSTQRSSLYPGELSNIVQELQHRLALAGETLEIFDPTPPEAVLGPYKDGPLLKPSLGSLIYHGPVKSIRNYGATVMIDGPVGAIGEAKRGQIYIQGDVDQIYGVDNSGIVVVNGKIGRLNLPTGIFANRGALLGGPFIFQSDPETQSVANPLETVADAPPYMVGADWISDWQLEDVKGNSIQLARIVLMQKIQAGLKTVTLIDSDDELSRFMTTELSPYSNGDKVGYTRGWQSVPFPSD